MLMIVDRPPPDAEDLTFPRYWKRWQDGAALTAVIDRDGEATRGMALLGPAVQHAGECRRTVLSISVRRDHRRQGIATALLAEAEAVARATDATRLGATYSSRVRHGEALKALVERAGWSEPAVYEYRLAGRADWVFQALDGYAGFLASLTRRGYSHDTWSELTADDHACIDAMIAAGEVPVAFHPSTWDAAVQSPFSLALRKDGRLVGWVFGEVQSDGRSLLYHTGWVLPHCQRLGWLMGGLMEVCRRQAVALGPDSMAVYSTDADNHAMRGIMERRLLPYGPLWMESRLHTSKPLKMSPADGAPGHSG